jgi:hypothetical protein
VGPTKMRQTRDYPYDVAAFPSSSSAFCKLGCQMFFSEVPNNFTCKNSCEYAYRYQITTGTHSLTYSLTHLTTYSLTQGTVT